MLSTKIKIIILIVILFFVFLAVYFYYQPFQQQEITKSEKPEVKTEFQLQEQAGAIIKTKDFQGCDEIKDETYKTVCVNNIASNLANENLDISYCQKIDDKLVPIKDCEAQVIFKKSLDKESVDICQETKYQELQKQCQESFWLTSAARKEKPELCDNIQVIEGREFCRDAYLFQTQFTENASNFNCAQFKNNEVAEDCKIFKENISQANPNLINRFKSSLFVSFYSTLFR